MSDLDSPAAQRCQQREWLAERIGWGVITLTLLAALLGFLGPGPLTRAVRSSPSGRLTVEHNRIIRNDAPADITIRLKAQVGHAANPAVLAFSRDFLDHTKRDSVNPKPLSTHQSDERIVWNFARSPHDDSLQVKVRYQFVTSGIYETEITAAGETLTLSQVVLP